ncbi:MAG: DUF2652 domain-containing protein, partial [Candidatus Heimdallarchaeota archaeon]|nr:DUF2652 domain-containing protein [Candidatus Heimdallarchaeota archaeon]
LPDDKKERFNDIQGLIESTYFKFKTQVQQIALNTDCDCNACILIPSLDLKFFLHYGPYIVQDIAGIKELVGSDVNLIHRLTKNRITKLTGWKAYALYTEDSFPENYSKKEDMYVHHESYEYLGDVVTYNLNLRDWFKNTQEANKRFISEEEADLVITVEYDHPPDVLFEWLTNNEKRNQLGDRFVWTSAYRPNGSDGVGARNHCAHDGTTTRETVLDWSKPDYYTVESIDDLEKETLFDGIFTFQFIPTENGTRFQQNIKFTFDAPKEERDEFISFFGPAVTQTHQELNETIKKILASGS